MSAMSERIYHELLATKKKLEALRKENLRLEHHATLAYLEGVDQGRAQAIREAS